MIQRTIAGYFKLVITKILKFNYWTRYHKRLKLPKYISPNHLSHASRTSNINKKISYIDQSLVVINDSINDLTAILEAFMNTLVVCSYILIVIGIILVILLSRLN